MTEDQRTNLGKILWGIADQLRGAMNADDFRDYMLSFLFLRYLSDNYEVAAAKELGPDYPELPTDDRRTPLGVWYAQNPDDVVDFEAQMRKKTHYVIHPDYLWRSIAELARTQSSDLLQTLERGFSYIENESFASTFAGLFSEINLNSDKLGKTPAKRNDKLCEVIRTLEREMAPFASDSDTLGDAYEYLIGQFAADAGKKAGEFYTPQSVSTILSRIVSLDSQNPASGKKQKLDRVLDFACGSGSLLLNVRQQLGNHGVGMIYGQEPNITTYNLARMNMLLQGLKDTEFEIFHGDSLANDWPLLNEMNPAKKLKCDAVVANPPFSYRWKPDDTTAEDFRFKSHGVAPKSAADFAFLLHGFHFLGDEGTMAIVLPHGVLFRGGAEKRIRTKLLADGHIDTIIGLPSSLFYSTGIPVCVLVLKKCKKPEDVLVVNASQHYDKGRRQNFLLSEHIDKIVDTYQCRQEEQRYARRVPMAEIEKNDYNLNITRYVSTAVAEPEVDLAKVHADMADIDKRIAKATETHNAFLRELGLSTLEPF